MSFVTYAQNFEDVILWRALKDVESGFYIDIGAQDPQADSVSHAFYEAGWRGVHAEPNGYYANRIREARPDEEVVEAAIGTGDGPLKFYEVEGTGLSTGAPDIAEKHRAEGRTIIEREVPVMPLSNLLDKHGDRDIHWLKIDVEGMEASVVDSWPPSKVRPWIVVVESTLPNTTIESFEDWEDSLKELGYEFVYFDGMNRFYVSEQKSDLKRYFGPGPNLFDDFQIRGQSPYVEESPEFKIMRENLKNAENNVRALEREREWIAGTTETRFAELDEKLQELQVLTVEHAEASNQQFRIQLETVGRNFNAALSWHDERIQALEKALKKRDTRRFSHPVLRKAQTGFMLLMREPSSLKPAVRRNMVAVKRKARTVLKLAKSDPTSLPGLIHYQLLARKSPQVSDKSVRTPDIQHMSASNALRRQVSLQAAFQKSQKPDENGPNL